MPIDNAFATHPGRIAEAAEKKNEDFAHAWVKDKVSYQIAADGNGRSEFLNPASFVVNEIQRFIDTYSEPGMSVAEIKRMISGALHCANRVLLAFKKANGELYTNSVFATVDLTAITEKNELVMAHVGDGRIYLVRNQMLLACSFLFDEITDESLDNLNEEDMAAFNTWVANGGRETLKELSECDGETVMQIVDYLKDTPLYDSVRVNNKDFLLIHSGLGKFDPNKKVEDYSIDELLWTRPKLTQKYFDDMITIFGHTPTHFYGAEHRGKAIKTPTWIDIDTGAAYGGSPMLLRLDDMREFYA